MHKISRSHYTAGDLKEDGRKVFPFIEKPFDWFFNRRLIEFADIEQSSGNPYPMHDLCFPFYYALQALAQPPRG